MKGRQAGIQQPDDAVQLVPPPPSILDKDAKRIWREILPDLVQRRILAPADMVGLRNFCIAAGKVEKLERAIKAMGDSFDPQLYRAQDKAMTTARQIGDLYGLSPTSRSRPAIRDADNDGDEALLD
ncbi:P27 family phage terminase small subunit [Rhizobium sp. Rhizsp82]|uniref:P27 family phage terminase small subunit n=1 Tax=Rhizobium sp. Rhizsp82 TaxID=3243057 RepID=UPI0039B59646